MRRFFRKRLPAFLLTLVMVMTMVPAVSAKSSADLTYEVDKGDSVSFKEREFRDLYRSEYSGDPSYVVFTDYSDLDDYGYLTAVNYYDKTVKAICVTHGFIMTATMCPRIWTTRWMA